MKLAGAPISWGVCEVPNWGLQLAPDRVLADMRALGVHATEAGPPGFLPADPAVARALLDSCALRLIGGFVTAVLHESARRVQELASVKRQAEWLAAGGAEVLVLAPALAQTGYSGAAEIGDAAWPTLFDGIGRAVEIADANGLRVAVHPHWGTAIERRHHIERFLEGSAILAILVFSLGSAGATATASSTSEVVTHLDVTYRIVGGTALSLDVYAPPSGETRTWGQSRRLTPQSRTAKGSRATPSATTPGCLARNGSNRRSVCWAPIVGVSRTALRTRHGRW